MNYRQILCHFTQLFYFLHFTFILQLFYILHFTQLRLTALTQRSKRAVCGSIK